MTQTYSAVSIYGLGDRMDAAAFQNWINFHKRLKHPPRFITLFTAARFNEAPNLLHQIRDSLPLTTPVWRGYDGKDAWGNIPPKGTEWTDASYYINMWDFSATSARMAAGMWFARRVQPYVAMIRETKTIVHLLNEATALFNAPFETECIRILGEEGIRAGAFAWAAGTPDWPDYAAPMIEDEVKMAAKYDALVMTHEYGGIKPEQQNSLIARFDKLVTVYDQLKLSKPDVYIGEFGLAAAKIINSQIFLDPNNGWRNMGVTSAQYMDFIKGTAKTWYVPKKASFSLYSGEDWGTDGSFGVMGASALLDLLVDNSDWLSFIVEEKPMITGTTIIARPPEAQSSVRVRLKSIPSTYRNLRAEPNYLAPMMGEISVGDVGRRFDIPARDGLVASNSSGKWVFFEKLSGETVVASGWIWRDRATWENVTGSTQEVPVVVTPAPADPEPPVLPPPPQETWPDPVTPSVPDPASDHTSDVPATPPAAPVMQKMQYSWEIETTPEMHEIIQGTIMTMLNNMAILGQALARAHVTLNTTAVA